MNKIIESLIFLTNKIFFVIHKIDNINRISSDVIYHRTAFLLNIIYLGFLSGLKFLYFYVLFYVFKFINYIISVNYDDIFKKNKYTRAIKIILSYIFSIFIILLGIVTIYTLIILPNYQKFNKFITLLSIIYFYIFIILEVNPK